MAHQPPAQEPKKMKIAPMLILLVVVLGLVLIAVIFAMARGGGDEDADVDVGTPGAEEARDISPEVVPATTDAPQPMTDADWPGTIDALPARTVAPGTVDLTVDIALPQGMKFNPAGPTEMIVRSEDESVLTIDNAPAARYAKPTFPRTVSLGTQAGDTTLVVDLDVYYCEKADEAKCYTRMVRLRIPLTVQDGAADSAVTVKYTVPAKASLL